MPDVSATEAARHFADLLDAVERGEEFRIIRRGRAVASLEPVVRGRGAEIKAVLRRHVVDAAWGGELTAVRGMLSVEERP